MILGIESSCDETAAAIMHQGKLLSHTVATQLVHKPYGGVVPELAARAHQVHIVSVVDAVFQKAGITVEDLEAVAVTQGPGLLGGLMVGIAFANGLSLAQQIPIVGIHHTKAHLLASFITSPYPAFPFLGVVVSGGHTQLVEVASPIDMVLLGSTLDDAVGEAFDKIAKMMGMPYPGGMHIDHHAIKGNPDRFSFPMAKVPGLNFSFSGIKTSFLYFLQKETARKKDFIKKHRRDLCASIQSVLVAMIISKITQAMIQTGLQRIVIGGGVANNTALRKAIYLLAKEKNWEVFIPSPSYCTDNAAMIAMAGHFILKNGHACRKVSLHPMPNMPF